MSAKKETTLSAYFPGLIDICEGTDGQLLYLTSTNGEISLQDTATTSKGEVTPPNWEHLTFLVPRAEKVMSYINQDDTDLYQDVLAYLKRFSALDENQWSVVAHFVFISYLHDHEDISYCPILLFYAVPERGKSRTGKSVSYVAFRGTHLSELRVPYIFRYSESLHGTLFFDIMDVWKKAEKNDCQDILLGRFEKGLTCPRILYPEKGPFLDTKHFDIYGPTIIATNEQLHKILNTRCLPIIMPNLPGNYENPAPEKARELKERLTAWRARNLNKPLRDISQIDGISGRLWDISKPLLQIARAIDTENFIQLTDAILEISGEQKEAKQETTEGRMVAIIRELTDAAGYSQFTEWHLKTIDIHHKFNEGRPIDKHVSPQWIGTKLKSLSLRHRTINGRSEIILSPTEYKTLLSQYGLALPPQIEISLPVEYHEQQTIAGVVGISRELSEPLEEAEPAIQ